MHCISTVLPFLFLAAQSIHSLEVYPSGPDGLFKAHTDPNEAFLKSNKNKHLTKLNNVNVFEEVEPRLPNASVVPLLYKVHLDFDSKFQTCTGSVEIDLMASKETREITLRAWKETIDRSTAYVSSSGQYSTVADIEYTEGQKAILRLKSSLIPHLKYTLHLNFINPFGLFITSFNNSDNLHNFYISQIAVSRLVIRSTSTTLLFPCFTERRMKANFSMRITNDLNYTALTNMPLQSIELDTKRTTSFQTSPEMSPHLVTIVITDLHLRSNRSAMSHVWARSTGNIIQTDVLQLAISEMEVFTNIKLPLPKIDHVAVPNGLVDDNDEKGWGLLLYNEDDPTLKKVSQDDQRPVSTISRAVASQWFGGLVTAYSWGCHWLDEGFSTFFGIYLSQKMGNEAWDQFLVDELQDTLHYDANPRWSQPITSDSYSHYGSVSRNKGASFLRMVAELLTTENFKLAVQKYLAENVFRTVVPDDLFKIFEQAFNESHGLPNDFRFTDFAISWTKQAGVPLLNVARNYKTGEVVLTQQRFFDREPEDRTAVKTRWWIPLSWTTGNETVDFTSKQWLRADSESVTITLPPGESSLLLNLRSVGYFRVNYDEQNWLYLAKDMRTTPERFSVANRAQIIDDAYALVKAGHVNITVALEILRLLEKETNLFVWTTGIKVLSHIRDNVKGTDVYLLLEKFIQRLMKLAFSTVRGLKPYDPHERYEKVLLRSKIAYLACACGEEQCIQEASETFERWDYNSDSPSIDELLTTLCGTFKKADEKKFWDLRGLITDKHTSQNLNMLHALAQCTDDRLLIKAHLEDLFQANGFLSKNTHLTIEGTEFVSSSPLHWNTSFEFLKENIWKMTKATKYERRRLVMSLVHGMKTYSQYEKVCEWIKNDYVPKSGDESIIRLLDDPQSKEAMAWNDRHLADMKNWTENLLYFEDVTTSRPIHEHITLHSDRTTSFPDYDSLIPTVVDNTVSINGNNARCLSIASRWFACIVVFSVIWEVW